MKGISCAQRLSRDVAELFSSDFNCTASYLSVYQSGESLNEPGSINLESKVFEGPYRGGRFQFCFHIPANYPFKPVEVWATQPIWHPNIDLKTGKVSVPLEWSPVLTLHAFALAVQMLMLEPSSEAPLNLESYSAYLSSPEVFDKQAQLTLRGGWFSGVHFDCCLLTINEMAMRNLPILAKRGRDDHSEDESMEIFDRNSRKVYGEKKSAPLVDNEGMVEARTPLKRPRKRADTMEETEEEEVQRDRHQLYSYNYEEDRYQVHSAKRSKLQAVQRNVSDNQISLAYSKLSLQQEFMDVSSPLASSVNSQNEDLENLYPAAFH